MKKLFSALLVLTLILGFAACSAPAGKDNETPDPSEFLSESFKIGFLKGPTGIGAAQLMEEAEKGNLQVNYDFTLEADASVIAGSIINGSLTVAAVPTNMASTLYNKTEGKVKIVAINTLGVLHILEKGNTVNSVADLKGKTIYATGQGSNPEYVLNYILRKNGLEPGVDVTVEYLVSDELTTRMTSGEFDICMLPVPAATTVLMKNKEVRDALDLTEEWAKVSDSTLTQGCIVARVDDTNDDELALFLKEYGASIEYMSNEANLADGAALAVKFGIVGAEPVAKAAIPNAGLTFITGADEMKAALNDYFNVLFEAGPSSIGGKLPADDIYYEVQ